jgi:hypothetical protein
MSFMSQENAQHLTTLLARFFRERLKVTLTTLMPEPDFRALLAKTMRGHAAASAGMPLEQVNRAVLTEVKNALKLRLDVTGPPEESPDTTESVLEDADEAAFFQQLQEIQQARQAPIVPLMNWSASTAPAPTPTPASASTLPTPASPASPASLAPAPTTQPVLAAAVPVPRREWVLNSADRPWTYSRPRATFPWSPPPGAGNSAGQQLRLARVMVPTTTVIQTSPVISVRIDGPGSASVQASAAIDRVVGPWAVFAPAAPSLGHFWSVALPWTVRLQGMDGLPLPLGSDGWSFQKVEIYPPSEAVFTLEDGVDGSREFDRGDRIEIVTTSPLNVGSFRARVLQGVPRSVHVDLSSADATFNVTELQKGSGVLLNHTRQAVVILETDTLR